VSQAITPTSAGSMLCMIAGDWSAGNTFVARANCTLEQTYAPAFATFTLIRPTTQPLPDTSAFTLGETDTAGTIAWVAFELQAQTAAEVALGKVIDYSKFPIEKLAAGPRSLLR